MCMNGLHIAYMVGGYSLSKANGTKCCSPVNDWGRPLFVIITFIGSQQGESDGGECTIQLQNDSCIGIL